MEFIWESVNTVNVNANAHNSNSGRETVQSDGTTAVNKEDEYTG